MGTTTVRIWVDVYPTGHQVWGGNNSGHQAAPTTTPEQVEKAGGKRYYVELDLPTPIGGERVEATDVRTLTGKPEEPKA